MVSPFDRSTPVGAALPPQHDHIRIGISREQPLELGGAARAGEGLVDVALVGDLAADWVGSGAEDQGAGDLAAGAAGRGVEALQAGDHRRAHLVRSAKRRAREQQQADAVLALAADDGVAGRAGHGRQG